MSTQLPEPVTVDMLTVKTVQVHTSLSVIYTPCEPGYRVKVSLHCVHPSLPCSLLPEQVSYYMHQSVPRKWLWMPSSVSVSSLSSHHSNPPTTINMIIKMLMKLGYSNRGWTLLSQTPCLHNFNSMKTGHLTNQGTLSTLYGLEANLL